eukprot:868988-Amphidinium_carterae.1
MGENRVLMLQRRLMMDPAHGVETALTSLPGQSSQHICCSTEPNTAHTTMITLRTGILTI